MITPDYYSRFSCIAGACKNSCCIGAWDIEVDDETLKRYKRLGGEFGKTVMESIGDNNAFIRCDGKCPMFTDDGLCELVKHGEPLCVTCDEYPRYTRDYDDYIEKGLALSCEAAADVILNNKNKVTFVGETGECDDELFPILRHARDEIYDILQNRDINILKRIRLVLDYGMELRERVNNNDYSVFSYTPMDRLADACEITPYLDFIDTLTVTDNGWHGMLENAAKHENIDEVKTEQLAVYFVERYFLQSVFDCDPLAKLKLMALSVMAILCIAEGCDDIFEAARVYSVEIEHSEDNIDEIYDEFMFNPEFEIENIINMIA